MSKDRGGRPAKLTPAEVERARKHHQQGIPTNAIAATLNVAGSTLRRYLRGECRQHNG